MKADDEILTNYFFKKSSWLKCVLRTSISFLVIHIPPWAPLYNPLPGWTSDPLISAYLCLLLKWAHKYSLNPKVLMILVSSYIVLILIFLELIFSEETSYYSILGEKSLWYLGLRVFCLCICGQPSAEWAVRTLFLLAVDSASRALLTAAWR